MSLDLDQLDVLDELYESISAISNKNRLKILSIIAEENKHNNTLSAFKIREILLKKYEIDISRQAIGKHLKQLVAVNLIKKERKKKTKFPTYKINQNALNRIFLELGNLKGDLTNNTFILNSLDCLNENGILSSLSNQASIVPTWSLNEAMNLLKEKENICRELGNKNDLQMSLGSQALILNSLGRVDEAMNLLKEKEKICRDPDNKEDLAIPLFNQDPNVTMENTINKNPNNNFKAYVEDFFDGLELYDDKYNNHNYKDFFYVSVMNFLENKNEYNASEIYRLFFEIYQITHDEPNLMLELVETLKKYEENMGDLIEKQRDYYIHSVNVFLLGLAIYSQNKNYKNAFLLANKNKYYNYHYKTKNEEFFYRWGIAALLHNIGYPLEIFGKRMKTFMNEGVNSVSNLNVAFSFKNFDNFNTITKIDPHFPDSYRDSYKETNFIDLFKPLDILAHRISIAFNDINLLDIKKNLDNFVKKMIDNGSIDPDFYSAILVTSYYGYLVQKYGKKSEFFFFPIVDSASAILLHNYYSNVLMSKRGNLKVNEHPIAYLLILCNELQEWNRPLFGIEDKKEYSANELKIEINNEHIAIDYVIKNGTLSSRAGMEKSEFLDDVLDINNIFKKGLLVNTHIKDKIEKSLINTSIDLNTPRQTISNIEKLARSIHEIYSVSLEKQEQFETFDDLPKDMKYSYFRQASSIPNKLNMLGYEIVPRSDKRKIKKFTDEEIEKLAIIEHDEWVKERINSGWVYSPHKNIVNKKNPYIVPWEELKDDVMEYDRKAVKNIPKILNSVGMKVVEKKLS